MSALEYPRPILERYQRLLGDELQSFLTACAKPLPSFIRVNTLKITVQKLKERLEARGWILHPLPFYADALRVETEETLGNTLEHFLGYYYVQDAASMLPPLVADLQAGLSVLDMCAAPGSKTTECAQLMENTGVILANEIDKKRIHPLRYNAQRCGVQNALIVQHSGIYFQKQLMEFDRVLVDAPCSAEGTVRKDPSLPKYLSLALFQKMSRLQKSLIQAAFSRVKQGGFLIYSTCTLAPEENEGVVQHLLDADQRAELVPIALEGLRFRSGLTQWGDDVFSEVMKCTMRVYPQDNDTEGFFIAKVRKR